MTDTQGRFVWYELMTTDTEAAKAFYGKVVGWGTQDMPMPGMTYTMFTAGETPMGGLLTLPEEARKMGAPPHWIGYVAVDDVDASASRAGQLGGSVIVPPTDIPEVGRFAIISDPQAATIALFKSKTSDASAPPAPGTPGRTGWHELLAVDWQKALTFYSALFGWQKLDAVDIGPMGTYQLFGKGGEPTGGMFNKPAEMPFPFWLYYFNVGDIDAAGGRVKDAGGQILMGPMQVPGGDWIIQGMDPQGAMFALVGSKP
ncbi:VOC family protein [Vineibacter terrae]|uniref:VOC family protein n=1 Tax=Vineibacter terrae TaxID=2586908 RepID=A0A5C8PUK1_9HYPH|nr:VOC family protein [Vineibacter terrae]TXL81695.1 VOC family protein [Vineibacter terrae]